MGGESEEDCEGKRSWALKVRHHIQSSRVSESSFEYMVNSPIAFADILAARISSFMRNTKPFMYALIHYSNRKQSLGQLRFINVDGDCWGYSAIRSLTGTCLILKTR